MTIFDYIIEHTATALEERKERLIKMDAPDILIDNIVDELIRLYQGELICFGDTELLDAEFKTVIQKKGRGGILYYTFNGDINYFPKAKYGRFVAKGEVR
jgi:hypothetical protein